MSINRPKRATFRSNRESPTVLDQQEEERPANWSAVMEGKTDGDFRTYSVKETYSKGDGVQHPKFGQGVVVAVEPTKIDVLFESGERRLVHSLN